MNLTLKLCLLYEFDTNISACVLWHLDVVLSCKLLIWLFYLGAIPTGGSASLSSLFKEIVTKPRMEIALVQ